MAVHLITGGAGFIGSHLATALVERGDRVRVLDDLATGDRRNLSHLEVGELGSGAPVEFIEGSITQAAACSAACQGVHGLFHQAAQVSVPQSVERPERSYEVNVTGTLRVLEAARASGVRRVIFAASSAAYGNSEALPKVETMRTEPLSPYAASKVAAETLLDVWGRVYGLSTVALRYFNVFGPRQADDSPYTGVIAIFARALLEGRAPTIYGDGEQSRDFTYIDNVVAANLAALTTELDSGQVINIGTGSSITLNQLYRRMASILNVDLEPTYGPERTGDVRHSVASIERARELLGYEPAVDWETGLEQTVAWYREHLRRS